MNVDTVAGAHGGDAARVAAARGIDPADLLDLSMSLNPFAPDITGLVREHAGAVARYPDPMAAERVLAAAIGVSAARLVLTNGGAEAIALVAAHQPVGDVCDPEFSLYRRHLRSVEPGAPRWRSNPSNPLGSLVGTVGSLDGAVGAVGAPGDVWDEAFYPLATGRWTDRALDAASVWRLGSLTKLWACPGLRLGYAIAPDAGAAAALRLLRPRWSVNALALSVVEPMLERTDLAAWSDALATTRADLASGLERLGFDVEATDANWLLIRGVADLRTRLVAHGVLIRDCTNFGLPGTFRVAVPHADRVEAVVAAFCAVVRERHT